MLTDKFHEDCFGTDDFLAVRKQVFFFFLSLFRILDRNGKVRDRSVFKKKFVYVKACICKKRCHCGVLKGVRYDATK